MKILSQTDDGATIELTKEEVGMLGLVGVEFTTGPHAPSDEEWEELIPKSRDQVASLFEALPTFE